MSSRTQMEELSISQLISKYNFIVPEIQREYVWGKAHGDEILKAFFNELIEKNEDFKQNIEVEIDYFKNHVDTALQNNAYLDVVDGLNQALSNLESNISINIGFLYSYRPSYYMYNDLSEDVYLIDGQQRFTTLVLALLFFALKEDDITKNNLRWQKFCELFRVSFDTGKIAFDYRVRSITHHFVLDLIANSQTLVDLKTATEKNWFLATYRSDESVKAMLGTIKKLFEIFEKRESLLFDFILTKVKFWHFKTEETTQGEELYITMNSRGKALSKHEILRAKLFKRVDATAVKEWGLKWEKWQDFFWEHKEQNGNADIGFNEFLRWVQILKMVEGSQIDTVGTDDNSKDKIKITETLKWEKKEFQELDDRYISLDAIDEYFEALFYLFKVFVNDISILKSRYTSYFRNILISPNLLRPQERKISDEKINTISQIDSFRLFPILEYCKIRKQLRNEIDPQFLYRLMNYLNNLAKQSTITRGINAACINAIKLVNEFGKLTDDIGEIANLKKVSATLLSQEERFKFQLYLKNSFDNRREGIEQEFWKAEDLKLNNGRIGHLIQGSYFNLTNLESYKFEEDFKSYVLNDFNLDAFISILNKFNRIGNASANNFIPERVWGNLIPTSYYNVQIYSSPKSIVCNSSDEYAMKSKEYLNIVLNVDLSLSQSANLSKIESDFFGIYLNEDSIKSEIDLKRQLFIHFVINYKTNKEFFGNKGRNFGVRENVLYGSTFFKTNNHFEHFVERWGGAEWRYLVTDKSKEKYLPMLLDGTFWKDY